MIAASYTRRSVKFGEAISIQEQNEGIERFAKAHRMNITKKYSDRKENVESEEGFLDMKEAGFDRRFDCIVFWSMMCFGKDPLNGYNLLRHAFLPAGIDFAVVSDDFISVGKTKEEIEEYLLSKYKERRKAHSAMVAILARRARTNTLYGYKIEDGEFSIDPKVKPIVDEIFKMALAGSSAREICNHLNENGITPPQIYLRKEAGRSTDGQPLEWNLIAVKKILTDSRYKGVRKVSDYGAISLLPFPAYIDDAVYDIINSKKMTSKRTERWQNPLSKLVFDKETDIKMYAGDYLTNGGNYYFVSKRAEHVKGYKKKAIPVDTVLREVAEALKREHLFALSVLGQLRTSGEEAENQTSKYRLELKKVFEQMLCAADLGDAETICKLDKRFSELQDAISQISSAFNMNNPWIKLYAEMPPDIQLTAEAAKQYVGKVQICRNESVEFIPKFYEKKSFFPNEWLTCEV